ncbi:glucose dehydrogenase [FAD, quinone]-like [Periplaneta americana]|uniref:glucose dehydrogenase [FAD, quinone]-like n=1 Tax=Periplaneta americana TaxID=6978 RepID=UPI0037E89FF7
MSSGNVQRSSEAFTFGVLLLTFQVHAAGIFSPPEYDFIIVGGGTAGCLLASRLSDNPDWSVLLVEAGGDENWFQDVPFFASLQEFTSADWGYRTEPSKAFCLGMDSGRCHWPRGKVFGGTSVINYMTYTRGNKADYDKWKTLGNTGWGYDDVLPFFLKHEDMTIPEYINDTKYHSTKGEVVITHPPYHTKLATAFLNAGIERHYKNVDYNGANQIGYSYLQSAMKNGRRWSAYHAFLEPARKRKNLHIVGKSMVTKILIDKDSNSAYGIEYKWYGLLPVKAHAKKEVIVSAGTINSPQLLMLSGIGPEDHLQEVGIPVIKNSKVGYNLQDHVTIGNLYFTVNDSVSINVFNIFSDVVGIAEYIFKHSGIFTVPGGTEVVGFEDLDHPSDGNPDIEILFASIASTMPIFWKSWGARTDILLRSYFSLILKNTYMILPILLHPYSRGRIMLKNRDPFTHPLIYPNYFSDLRDIEVIIKGIRIAIEMAETEAMQKYGATLYQKPLLECRDYEFNSDSYWECIIRQMTFTMFHPSGTCKMGPESDEEAVVDTTLRVRGIKGLRVVDASVIPLSPAGHIMATVYMIAEKASHMIKEYWS